MKTQTLAKRKEVPHENQDKIMSKASSKASASLSKPRTSPKSRNHEPNQASENPFSSISYDL